MSNDESAEQTIARIAGEARAAASQLPHEQRAELIREVVYGVRNAVKEDLTPGGAPGGRESELEGLNPISDAAEKHYEASVKAKQDRERGL